MITTLSASPEALCVLDKENTIISTSPNMSASYTIKVCFFNGELEAGKYQINLEVTPKKFSRAPKTSNVYLKYEVLGTEIKYFSEPFAYTLNNKTEGDTISLDFNHETPMPVKITLVAQNYVKEGHELKIGSATLEKKSSLPKRRVFVKKCTWLAEYTEKISLPKEISHELVLHEKKLGKGDYLLYILGCGKGVVSVERNGKSLVSKTLTETHQEHLIKFSMPSSEVVAIKLSCQGEIHLNRLRLDKETNLLKEKEKLAMVIPSYNAEETLERSVLSVLNQTLPPHTIFIVDDCSKDGTLSLAKQLKETYSGAQTYIEVFSCASNLGPYACKNLAVSKYLEHYDYWCLQDADDYILSEKIMLQYEGLKDNVALSSYTFGNRVTNTGEIVKNRGLDARRIYAGAVFKKELFKKIGFFEPTRFGADDELFCRKLNMLGKDAIKVHTEPLYKAEVRSNSLTNAVAKMALDTEKEKISPIRKAYQELFQNRGSVQNSFGYQKDTPAEMKTLPTIHIHMATYPKRFKVALKTAEKIYETCERLGGAHLHLCFNESHKEGAPSIFKDLLKKPNVHGYTPERDLKDNGKFLNVSEGINFWVDDDLIYTLEYFIISLTHILRHPKNTSFCLHGYNGTETTGYLNRNLIHFSNCPEDYTLCAIAGTGTASMWIDDTDLLRDLNKIPQSQYTGMVDLIYGHTLAKHQKMSVNIPRDQILLESQDDVGEENLFTTNKSKEKLLNDILALVNLTHTLKLY